MRKIVCVLLTMLAACLAKTSSASVVWMQTAFEFHPLVTLIQPTCPVPGTCGPIYEFGYSYSGTLLDSSAGPAPSVLDVVGSLTVSDAYYQYFLPYKLLGGVSEVGGVNTLSGPYRAVLSTGPLVGTNPEIHVAILRRTMPATAELHGAGSVDFSAPGGETYYAIVYGFGVEGLSYRLTVTAIPEPRIGALMLLGLGLVGYASRYRTTRQRPTS